MPRQRGEPPAVRVYTVCDESRYLIVRNVPAVGCGEELAKLFGSYGEVEECKPMDEEDSEPFTDVYWIKFSKVNNSRFAKRKLDEFVFYGSPLQVSYAPKFETLLDTKEKLEGRRKEVLARIKSGKSEGTKSQISWLHDNSSALLDTQVAHTFNSLSEQIDLKTRECGESEKLTKDKVVRHISSNKEYFSSPSMNKTVQLIRDKLDEIESSRAGATQMPKKPRRRI